MRSISLRSVVGETEISYRDDPGVDIPIPFEVCVAEHYENGDRVLTMDVSRSTGRARRRRYGGTKGGGIKTFNDHLFFLH